MQWSNKWREGTKIRLVPGEEVALQSAFVLEPYALLSYPEPGRVIHEEREAVAAPRQLSESSNVVFMCHVAIGLPRTPPKKKHFNSSSGSVDPGIEMLFSTDGSAQTTRTE